MKLLVTGNIGYITTEFIEEAFPECQILLLGETEQKSNRNKSLSVYPMPKTEEEFKDIFKTYEFEGVIYFSNYLTFHGTMEGEIETLHKLLHYYKGNLNSRLLYITGPDSLYEDTTGKTLMVRSAEEFCRQYGELHQIAVKILRVPYLYSGTYEEDYFFKLFSTVINKKQITFEEAPAQEMHFLALSDLGDLLYKIFDNWGEGSACLQVPQVFHFTFQQFGERLAQMFPTANITYLSDVLIRDGISDETTVNFENEYSISLNDKNGRDAASSILTTIREEKDAQLALAPYYYFTSSIYKGECTCSRVGLMTAKSSDTPLYLAKINGKEIYELAEKYLADSDEKFHITNKYELPIASGMKIIVRQEENGFSLKDIEVNKKKIDKEKEYSILLTETTMSVLKKINPECEIRRLGNTTLSSAWTAAMENGQQPSAPEDYIEVEK